MEYSVFLKGLGVSDKQLLTIYRKFDSCETFAAACSEQQSRYLRPDQHKLLKRYLDTGHVSEYYSRTMDWLCEEGIHLVDWSSPTYPDLLKEIANPPALLFIKGALGALAMPQLAIVGARQCSAQGQEQASEFASTLGGYGFAITSGLALGIDGAAHRAAVNAGQTTIAVLGNGIDLVYPKRHGRLSQDILASGGALVTEFMPGTPPKAAHFPQRNRIVTGMSLAVVVIEASLASGSLISARLSAEQGREVFALPGSIRSPVSEGCHQLIRDGATLVTSPDQVIEPLGPLLTALRDSIAPADKRADLSQAQQALKAERQNHWLLQIMGSDPVDVDYMTAQSGRPIAQVVATLSELEVKGWVRQTNYGYQQVS